MVDEEVVLPLGDVVQAAVVVQVEAAVEVEAVVEVEAAVEVEVVELEDLVVQLLTQPDLQWSETTTDINAEAFTQEVGPKVPISARILDIFKVFFSATLIDFIVTQTNLYASQVMSAAQYAKWTDVTAEEIWAFFRFMILMGINQLPALRDYWKLDPTYRYNPIACKITRDRFLEILRYIHFVDNTTLLQRPDPAYDKLGKIRPVIDHLSEQFLSAYNPHQQVSIDEAMIAFKGRSSMKQYIPKKPIKRGFKAWVRADAVTGYGE